MRFAGTELGQYMSTPDFTGLGRTMMEGQSMKRQAVNMAEGEVAMAGINSVAKVKSAGFEADAIKAGGAAQGQAAMASGIGSLFSGLAGGISSLGGGGGGGSYYSYGGTGGKYGSLDTGSVRNAMINYGGYTS